MLALAFAGDVATVREASAQAAVCNGNLSCAGAETAESCPSDCPAVNGDGFCTHTETAATAPGDCPAVCDDGLCTGTETVATCASDCDDSCGGDTLCTGSETCSSCPSECATGCGDGCCIAPETAATCASDCPAVCPDGACTGGENADTCASDCPDTCGDGYCSASEDTASCAGDCPVAASPFGICDEDLPDCTATVDSCCKRPMNPVGSDRAILIPLDRCHQKLVASGINSPPGSSSPEWCEEEGASFVGDDGIKQAYGLVFRLMQEGIPVHWAINPTKDPQGRGAYTQKDIDMWVLSSTSSGPPDLGDSLTSCTGTCDAPVVRLDPTDLSTAAWTYPYEEFPLRGSVFIIAPEDRADFEAFWLKQSPYNVSPYTTSDYDFSDVDLWEVQTNAQLVYQEYDHPSGANFNVQDGVPISLVIDYEPPRLVKQTGGPSSVWLSEAKLNTPATNSDCLTADFVPSNAVFCNITNADVSAGLLDNANHDFGWFDNGGFDCDDVDEFRDFMTAVPDVKDGGSALFMESTVTNIEDCTNKEILGEVGTGLTTVTPTLSSPYILRAPTSPFAQWGDWEADFAQGAISGWGNGTSEYETRDSLVRLVSQDLGTLCANNISTGTCDNSDDVSDLAAYARHDDVAENGVALYAPGNNISQNTNVSHWMMVMNALLALPASKVDSTPVTPTETSRSSPVLAEVDGTLLQFQGTFDRPENLGTYTTYSNSADDATFTFPHATGHFRGLDFSALSTSAVAFGDDLDSITEFDVATAGFIPNTNPAGCGAQAFTASCRTVFTNTASGATPTRVDLSTANTTALEPLMEGTANLSADETNTLIARVLAGYDESGTFEPRLGGVDRSTPAIIEASSLAGVSTRPKMAYFGATDGMLHAVCAEVVDGTGCDVVGQELWAYIPRTQLAQLRLNTARVDGSPSVADVFADFEGQGIREWRTVLAFQTGSGDPDVTDQEPAVVALDITDPFDPQVLWELTLAGTGVGIAMGPTQVGGTEKHLAFVTTNRGSGTAGFNLQAIEIASGDVEWSVSQAYPSPRDSTNPDVPETAMPAGPSAVDLINSGQSISHLVVPDIYGSVWLLDASDGSAEFSGEPLFRFSADFKPIGAEAAIWRDAADNLHAVIGSGGYVDPLAITSWSPNDAEQFVVSFELDTALGSAPIDETSGLLDFADSLGTGNRVFAAPLIAGGELFVVSDTTDVNDLGDFGSTVGTGRLQRYSLAAGDLGTRKTFGGDSFLVIAGGSGSARSTGGVLTAGGGGGTQKVDVSADFDSDGRSVDLSHQSVGGRATRFLWLQP